MNVIAYAIYTCSSNTTPRDIYCIHYNILVRINPEFLDDQSYAGISEIIILHGGTVALQAYCSLNLFIAKIAANIFYSKYICTVESHSRHCVFTYVSLKISHVRIDASVLYARAYMSVSSRLVSSRLVSSQLSEEFNTCGFHGRETPEGNWHRRRIRQMVDALRLKKLLHPRK